MLRFTLIAAAGLMATMSFGPVTAVAQDAANTSEAYNIARGGRIYDKWWAELKAPKPEENHALYPAAGKKSGHNTWRCKECHGWDYKGVDGAYASGSHFTGIKGVSGMFGADPAEITAILRGDDHGYTSDMIYDDAMADLALFISKGQIDPAPYMADGKPNGDAATGKVYYETVCSGCHGLDGKKIKDAKALGDAAGNTVETMHKIFNGQPDENMPAMRLFDKQMAVDITAHLQTLPK